MDTRPGEMQSTAAREVLGNADIVALVLEHAQLSPTCLAVHSRVCSAWRRACRTEERLLLRAALARSFLSKHDFMGLFALSSAEADTFPHGVRARNPSGFVFMYKEAAVRSVLPSTGGMIEWRRRVERRWEEPPRSERQYGSRVVDVKRIRAC